MLDFIANVISQYPIVVMVAYVLFSYFLLGYSRGSVKKFLVSVIIVIAGVLAISYLYNAAT